VESESTDITERAAIRESAGARERAVTPESTVRRERTEFSVWAFAADGTHWPLQRWVDARTAVETVKATMAHPPAGVVRVIITDGGDCTAFEWQRGEQQNGA